MGVAPGFFSGVAVPGSIDYFGLLFCPESERENLRLLLAFEKLLNNLSIRNMEPEVRQAKLSWWADEMSRIRAGKPAHPVAISVSELLRRREVAPTPLFEMFSAVVREASGQLPDNPDDLLDHAASRGALISLLAELMVATKLPLSDGSKEACREIGAARYLALIFHKGHTEHRQHGLDGGGHAQELQHQLATTQLRRVHDKLTAIPETERSHLLPLLVMCSLIQELLIHGDANGRRSSQLRSLIRAWRTAWRVSRGKLPS